MPTPRHRPYFAPVFVAAIAGAISSCSSTSEPNNSVAAGGTAGLAGVAGAAGTTGGTAGQATGAAGTSGSGGTGGSGGALVTTAGTGGSGGSGGGTGGTGGAGGTAGAVGSGGTANNVAPTCVTENVADGVDRVATNYIECDFEGQSIDFDVAANYVGTDFPDNLVPGYAPTDTPVTITDHGTAITGFAAQECHPYCFKGNLTVGLDFIAGADSSLRGEILFDFPTPPAPIADATGRDSLGWIFVDGPALPGGATLTAQMILKSNDKGILLANGTLDVTVGQWAEFKYFPIEQGFTAADLTNITSIGFRISLGPTAGATNWSGVLYADHFQLRQ